MARRISCGRCAVPGFGRILLIGSLLAGGLGVAGLHAQTVLGDPRDAARIFASNCSACHKSPQGLAKSGQVAGFLRQHYTTGPEMSAAMAAYLVAAGAAPAAKKGAATAESPPAKTKGKKPKKAAAGQREMLLPISGGGKRAAKETAKETVKEAPKKAEKPARSAARTKKAG